MVCVEQPQALLHLPIAVSWSLLSSRLLASKGQPLCRGYAPKLIFLRNTLGLAMTRGLAPSSVALRLVKLHLELVKKFQPLGGVNYQQRRSGVKYLKVSTRFHY